MKVRSALTAVLIGSLAVTAIGVSPGAATAGGSSVLPRVDTVTVTGTFERVVVDTVDGEHVRYLVRGSDRTWWLEDLAEPVPTTGSQVTVTGTPQDADTLSVATIQVRVAAAEPAANVPVRGTTRALVLRAYWGPRPPARPTLAATRNKVIRTSRAWFREVSNGRYSVSGVVTPWLRVPRPASCLGGSGNVGNQALAAAQRRGYRLASFQRFILYMPCDAGGILGYAAIPGQTVVLFDLRKIVVVHEQGHNLGLQHASSRECSSPQWGRVTWGRNCRVIEYGDMIDAMGNRRAGHYNAFYKARLGWLQRAATVTSTRTVTLRRYETTGPGLKAARVRARGVTYWLEYRTPTGTDRNLPRGSAGVQIRLQRGDRTQLLDAGPGSGRGSFDFDDVHLPVGSSWTTPQNVRITVTRQAPRAATVAIRFRARARAPLAPGPVRVQALDNAVKITWSRPADRGAIIRRYVITRTGGATKRVPSFAGLVRTYTWTGLTQGAPYRFSVQAVNQVGASTKATSPTVRPL